jgi:hypothetical protein
MGRQSRAYGRERRKREQRMLRLGDSGGEGARAGEATTRDGGHVADRTVLIRQSTTVHGRQALHRVSNSC